MTALRRELRQYIALRRALGTRLQEPAATLERFLDFLEREKAQFITSELALRWAMQPQGVQQATWARRLGMVRGFASWLSTIDSRTQVPPHRLLPSRRRRNKPHIFSPQEIGRLMKEASRLASSTGLRPLTYTTLIGLLTATGLRPGEALALNNSDVDLNNGILSIRQSKFGKSRFVPLTDSTRAALVKYAKQRDKLCLHPRSEAFLISERGQRLQGCAVRRTFARISCAVGVRPATGTRRIGRGPRLQDFRHCFATRKLIERYRAVLMWGVNCQSSPHTWGMWMSPTPTGISKPFRSYFNWPPTAWERTGSEVNSEHLQFSVSGSAFFHRPFANTTGGESTHDCRIPGHLSFVAPVRRNASSTRAIPTTNGRYRCALPGEVPGRP